MAAGIRCVKYVVAVAKSTSTGLWVVEIAQVMKDETRVTSKDQFVINVVVPTLVKVKGLSRTFL